MNKYYIYTLSCNGEVFYVGKTTNIERRLAEHIKESKKKRNHKERRIDILLSENKEVIISIIDEVEKGTEDHWEKYWISEYKNNGINLCNMSGGNVGDLWSGKKHSDKTKNKLSEIRYKQIKDGKIYRNFGESNGMSKLSSNDVLEIRRLRNCGYSYGKLSLKFKVAKSTIRDIILRKMWKHI